MNSTTPGPPGITLVFLSTNWGAAAADTWGAATDPVSVAHDNPVLPSTEPQHVSPPTPRPSTDSPGASPGNIGAAAADNRRAATDPNPVARDVPLPLFQSASPPKRDTKSQSVTRSSAQHGVPVHQDWRKVAESILSNPNVTLEDALASLLECADREPQQAHTLVSPSNNASSDMDMAMYGIGMGEPSRAAGDTEEHSGHTEKEDGWDAREE